MRIVWDTTESVFVAEFSDFAGDLESVKSAGFRTHGAPVWRWYAPSPGVVCLDRLRKIPPKSGLVITETALAHYKSLKEQFEKKAELRKTFKKLSTAAKNDRQTTPTYEKDGFTSVLVEPKDSGFVHSYVRPEPPGERCFLCGDPIYSYEYPDACLWCNKA